MRSLTVNISIDDLTKLPVDHWTHDGERIHHLKTVDVYFTYIAKGDKTFEVRKNDRDFQVGDILHLIETQDRGVAGYTVTGREHWCQVSYILHGGNFGIAEGFCVMAIKEIDGGLQW
jgi:hypothetical protein